MSAGASGARALTYADIREFMGASDWPVVSSEVAEEFGITQQAAYKRLKTMCDREEVERKKFNQTVLWRLAQ